MTEIQTAMFLFLRKLMLTFLDREEAQITPETRLDDLGMESLDFVELQVELQKRYGVQLDFSGLGDVGVATVLDFVRYVELLRATSAPTTLVASAASTAGA